MRMADYLVQHKAILSSPPPENYNITTYLSVSLSCSFSEIKNIFLASCCRQNCGHCYFQTHPTPRDKKQENLLLHFASKLRLKNLLSREAKMTEHHSQETLMSRVYPHCRQAALCSTDAIFSKWCNSCKGSPRAFHLRAQAILKHVTRNRITLCCHLPLLCTSILHTEITPSEVIYSRKGSNFTHQVKKI